MVIINFFQHRPITHERSNLHRIHEERALTRSLERETELPILKIEEPAKTINHAWGGRETDIRGIIHVDHAVPVQVAIANITRHHVPTLSGGIINLCLITENALGNVTDLL